MIFIVGGMVFSGCVDNNESRQPIESAVPMVPISGGTAVIAIASEPDALNPLVWSTSVAGRIFAELHDGLTEMDDDLNYVPRIAHRWEVGADRKSITYFMNRWRWSDGHPLTAYDVVRSYELLVDPVVASPRRGGLREISSATALDTFTVRYTFDRPQAEPEARSWHHILPLHIVGELDPGTVSSWPINSSPISSGEFLLESWDHNRSLVLGQNPSYNRTSALLDRVIFRILPEAATRVLALETGEVDLVNALDPDAARRLLKTGKINISSVGGRSFYYLCWNLRNPIFQDQRTRQALSLALDREMMLATLLKGYGKVANSPVPPALWNHHDQLPGPEFDPQKAREMLAIAGWRDDDGDGVLERDGVPFEFEILTRTGDPVRENGAVILRANLADVGVKVDLCFMDLTSGLARVHAGRFDSYLGRMNLNLFGDPTGIVGSQETDQFNYGHYANTEVDSLLKVATGKMTRAEALPVWLRLQAVLAVDQPAAYLLYPDNLVGVSKRLQNVRPHLLSPVNNLAEWWVAEDDRIYRTGK